MVLNPQYISINKQIDVPYLLKIGEGKIRKIGKYLSDKGMNNIAIFFGSGIEGILGKELNAGLEEHSIKVLYKKDVDNVSVEDITVTAFNLPKIDAIIGIGGGMALDFAKYSAYLLQLHFISVPTSASNDGFCSPTSSLTVAGKRKSIKSGIPYGVVVDLDIIRNSPKIFFYSGVGDMVSKITALWDWREAAKKGLERFSDFSSMLAYNSLELLFLRHSYDVLNPAFQRSLVNSLLTSGIAMEVAGTSRPASGSEHLISHGLDAVCKKPKMHGIQVGVATYLCALLQDNQDFQIIKDTLLKTGFVDFVKADPFDKIEFIEALKLAPSIKSNYYTILSENGTFDKAIELLESDEILREIIR